MNKPKILIIYTGGTIGMVETPQGLQPFDFSHLMDNVPKLSELGYQIDSVQPYRFFKYESAVLGHNREGHSRQL